VVPVNIEYQKAPTTPVINDTLFIKEESVRINVKEGGRVLSREELRAEVEKSNGRNK
jgi:hypothetical protein